MIPSKVIVMTVIISFTVGLFSWLIIGNIILSYFDSTFQASIIIYYVISMAMIIKGLADVINRFLSAKGQGILLIKIFLLTGICSLVINIILTASFSYYGAALGLLISSILYISLMIRYYLKFIGSSNCE